MQNFFEYLKDINEANRPEGQLAESDLEGFYRPLMELQALAKSVLDTQTKQQIYQLVNPFVQQMNALLDQTRQQGIGHSRNFDAGFARSMQYAMGGNQAYQSYQQTHQK